MKKDELRNEMETHLESAKSLLLTDGYLVPVAFVYCGNIAYIIQLSFKDQEDKEKQIALLRAVVEEKNADAVFTITESWYVMADKDLNIAPSEHPMRKECIFLIGECEEGDITLIQIFERKNIDDHEKIVFGEKKDIGISHFFGKLGFGIKDKRKNVMIDKRGLN